MPASTLTIHIQSGRGCAACGELRCVDAAQCLFWLTSRPVGEVLAVRGHGLGR